MSLTKEGSHPQKMRDGKKIAGWWSGVAPLRRGLGTTLWALSFVAALSLLGCEGSSADEVSIRDEMPYGLRDCPRPAEGCACDPGTPPVDCYVSRGGRCGKGAMYCRDGLFTACLDVEDVGLRPRTGFIAPGFSKCLSGCDPDCFVAHDSPDPWDLHDGNSTPELFRSSDTSAAPGVYLDAPGGGGGTGTLVDADGDGIADIAEDPGCVDTVSPSTGYPDSAGSFGCASGDRFGMYAELPPGGTATGTIPVIRPPLPPVDLYMLADLAVVHIKIEVDIPLIGVWTLFEARLTMDESVQDVAANFNVFANTVEGVYTSAGQTPDVRYGLGYFIDYQAWDRHGDPSNRAIPYAHHTDFTSQRATFASRLGSISPSLEARGVGDIGGIVPIFNAADLKLEIDWDWDWGLFGVRVDRIELLSPESHTQALYAIATGSGLPHGRNLTPAGPGCPAGQFGYPCFRSDAIPIVAVLTDDVMHNGPGGDAPNGRYPYDSNFVPVVARYGGNIKTLAGAGTASDPRVIPGTVETTYRLFDGGDTGNTSRSAGDPGCGGGSYGYRAKDETIEFTVGGTGNQPIRIFFERTGGWDDATQLALFASNGSLLQCGSTSGSHTWNLNLAPGTYRLRVDGARKNDGTFNIGNYEYTGRYRVAIGRYPSPWPIGYQSHVLPALQNAGIRVIALHGCSLGTIFNWYNCAEVSQARSQLQTLAVATGGTQPNGTAIVPSIRNGGGQAATNALADGVASLIRGVAQRIEFIPRDDPSTPVDERAFLSSLSVDAPGCSMGSCSVSGGALTCTQCNTNDQLRLNVSVYYDPNGNPAHPPQQPTPQVYELLVDVVAHRSVFGNTGTSEVLRTIPVRIVIPPERTLTPGTYWRVYDATIFDPSLPAGTPLCSIGGITGLRPDWSNLQWAATTPSNASGTSYIEFQVRTADDVGSLATAPGFCFRVPETAPASPSCPTYPASGVNAAIDVGARLVSSGATNYRQFLRVDATLYPTPDAMAGPTLTDMRTEYVCTPIE